MRLIPWCLVALMSVQVEGPASVAWGKSAYRMEGVVTDADTRLPVANATVQVLITSEPDPAKKIRKSATDEEGSYSIDLPAGHGWAWYLAPPEGYAAVETNPTEVFATSDERPVFTKNYEVRRGTLLRFVVRYPKSLAKPPKTYVSLSQAQGNDVKFASGELNKKGNGSLTLLQPAGKFLLFCGDYEGALAAPEEMAIEIEEGFDPRDVAEVGKRGKAGTVTVRDGAGRASTFTNCEATVHEKQLTVAIDLEAARTSKSVKLEGRVVDDAGNGIEGATVTLTFHQGGGSASSQFSTETDEGGNFSIPVSLRSPEQKVGLCITREGFGGLDTKPMDVASVSGTVDAGQITLNPASSIRVRVVGPDGKPLHGAVVEPQNDYASRTRITRTDADGECVLTDLAAGIMRVTAQFGKDATSTKIPLLPGENEVVVLKLKPTADVAATAPAPPPPALAAGTPAPEWTIAEWTDGKDRKLADYRGKVLVLDFWGVWCGPCIQAVPAMKELHDRYQDRDVVFLGIHTAGTDMTLVKRLLKQQAWDLAVGLDTGDAIVSGETTRSFSIQGYPTVMVIDRNGKIAFNSGDTPKDPKILLRDMEAMAKSAGVPWPIDKDADEDEIRQRMTRLQVFMFGLQIDKALQKPAA